MRDREAQRAPVRQPHSAVLPEERETGVKIVQFYAGSGEVVRGDEAIVCYGVREAASVRLEPTGESLRPARNRCISVSPRRTTTYTLVAEGFDGRTDSASFTLHVSPPPPRILFVEVSGFEVRRGEPWALCYGLEHALAARLEPMRLNLPVGRKRCMQTYLPRTMRYALVASGENNLQDREEFLVTVRDR
ncbi:MAG: hypothetical protein KIT09_32890 [Bryobacteraceae bacterium]|nr:hypothetical protein [Bryobacteraceae bacterium]